MKARDAIEKRRHLMGAQPLIGVSSLHVVLRSDFALHPEDCIDYAMHLRSIYVLDRDHRIRALICPHTNEIA